MYCKNPNLLDLFVATVKLINLKFQLKYDVEVRFVLPECSKFLIKWGLYLTYSAEREINLIVDGM